MRSEEENTAIVKAFAKDFRAAMLKAIQKAGSQKKLAEETGIHQSRISDYANGQYDFGSLTVGTLIKLFPELEILYFRSKLQAENDDDMAAAIERRMLAMFRSLPTENKVLCFEMMSRTFGDRFAEEEKKARSNTDV